MENHYLWYIKNQNTALFDRLRIVNNTINGGYYGIYLWGVDNFTHNTNLYIDNNTIKNAFPYGNYLRNNQFYSISENHIVSRANYVDHRSKRFMLLLPWNLCP